MIVAVHRKHRLTVSGLQQALGQSDARRNSAPVYFLDSPRSVLCDLRLLRRQFSSVRNSKSRQKQCYNCQCFPHSSNNYSLNSIKYNKNLRKNCKPAEKITLCQ